MGWIVQHYRTDRGQSPVEETIKGYPPILQGKIYRQVALLTEYGMSIGPPHVKKLERNLYELRVVGESSVRILFTVHKGSIYLLHIFKKKSQKLPAREMAVARRRGDL